MTEVTQILNKVDRSLGPVKKGAAIAATLAGIAVAYWFWRTNIWVPKVEVKNVNYHSGTADIIVHDFFRGRLEKKLYLGSAISAGGNWAIKFAGPNGKINRVELVKNDITYRTLNSA